MGKPRDTAKYKLERGGRLVRDDSGKVRRGITDRPLEEREREHQKEFPGAKIKKVGRETTREAALKWEREGGGKKR